MPRGYRSIIVALVGWLILANAAQHENGQRHKSGDQDGAHQRVTATSIIKPTVSSTPSQPEHSQCVGADNQPEDCTRASAQAAIDQARYARQQTIAAFIGVGVGAATLIAALLAAVFARNAVRAADATNRRTDAAQRPWMHIAVEAGTARTHNGKLAIPYIVKFTNAGDRPATCATTYIKVVPTDETDTALEKELSAFSENPPAVVERIIMPGETFSWRGSVWESIDDLTWRKSAYGLDTTIFLIAAVTYAEEGRQPYSYQTLRTFAFGIDEPSDPFLAALLPKSMLPSLHREKLIAAVKGYTATR